jgi:hypothetical protein
MGIGHRVVKKVMKTTVLKAMMDGLDGVELESLTHANLMEQYKLKLETDETLAGQVCMLNFTEDDFKDVLKDIVPKLRKEKEKRLKSG